MRRFAIALGLGLAFLAAASTARADVYFVAAGDSLVFGYDPSHGPSAIPSYGDQGWVKLVADGLASHNGGVRPTVFNSAIPGELSSSYLTADSPPGWTARAWQLNQNYADGTTAQFNVLANQIASIHAAGNTVGHVSLLFGSNDVFYLLGTPAYQNATPDQQQAMIMGTLGAAQNNYLTSLGAIKSLAPEARVLLPGYYNPYPAISPFHDLYQPIVTGYNMFIAGAAAAVGGTYVDLATPFAGRELELTNIASADTHPNQAGYQVIANAFNRTLSPAAVPEPASVALFALGALGLVGYRRFKK